MPCPFRPFHLLTLQVSTHISKQYSLPDPLLSHYSAQLLPECIENYNNALEEHRATFLAAVKSEFVSKFCHKFLLYLNGLLTITDKKLRGTLAQSLLKYAQDVGVPALRTLETEMMYDLKADKEPIAALVRRIETADADDPKAAPKLLEDMKHELQKMVENLDICCPSDDDLAEKKKGMMSDMAAQLETSGDLSLQMLLVLVLRHAAAKDGLLKASG
jgi:hypothetical protein